MANISEAGNCCVCVGDLPGNSSAITRTQQKVSTTVPTARHVMTVVQRGIMMTWQSTINIQMTNTHNMLELWGQAEGRNQLATVH